MFYYVRYYDSLGKEHRNDNVITAVTALRDGVTLLYGNESLNRRPVEPLLNALQTS